MDNEQSGLWCVQLLYHVRQQLAIAVRSGIRRINVNSSPQLARICILWRVYICRWMSPRYNIQTQPHNSTPFLWNAQFPNISWMTEMCSRKYVKSPNLSAYFTLEENQFTRPDETERKNERTSKRTKGKKESPIFESFLFLKSGGWNIREQLTVWIV